MPTKSTPSPSTPSFATIAPHRQYIKPALGGSSTTLIGEGGLFSVFLPQEIHQAVSSTLNGKLLSESIAERIEFGFDNAEVVKPVTDFPVAAVTTMAKISPLTYSRALMLSKLYFQENIGLTLGWLASISVNPKRWGIRSNEGNIILPWMKKPKQNTVVPIRQKIEKQEFDLSNLPAEWPSSADLKNIREATGMSAIKASIALGFSRTTILYYENGKRGTRMHRYRAVLLYIAWFHKNAPHRSVDMDETARSIATTDAMKLILEQQEDIELQVLPA